MHVPAPAHLPEAATCCPELHHPVSRQILAVHHPVRQILAAHLGLAHRRVSDASGDVHPAPSVGYPALPEAHWALPDAGVQISVYRAAHRQAELPVQTPAAQCRSGAVRSAA